jgi:hypothetical protein
VESLLPSERLLTESVVDKEAQIVRVLLVVLVVGLVATLVHLLEPLVRVLLVVQPLPRLKPQAQEAVVLGR